MTDYSDPHPATDESSPAEFEVPSGDEPDELDGDVSDETAAAVEAFAPANAEIGDDSTRDHDVPPHL